MLMQLHVDSIKRQKGQADLGEEGVRANLSFYIFYSERQVWDRLSLSIIAFVIVWS